MPEIANIRLDQPADLRRVSEIGERSKDDTRTFSVSMSSETPVLTRVSRVPGLERVIDGAEFYEVLGHQPDECRFDKLAENGPLLWHHNKEMHIGSVRFDSMRDGRAYGSIKLSRSSLGNDKLSDIEDGILKDTSLGYSVRKYRRVGERDGIPILRAVEWIANELSLTPTGADSTVGVGRSEEKSTTNKSSIMPEENHNKPAAKPEIDIDAERKRASEDATKAERKRQQSLRESEALCTKRGLVIPDNARSKADDEGWDGNQLIAHVLESQPAQNRETDTKVLDNMQRTERKTFSLCRAISGHMRGNVVGFEAEVIAEVKRSTGQKESEGGLLIPFAALSRSALYEGQRDMLAGVYGQGGSTVPVNTGEFISKLDPVPVVEQAGARMIRGLTAPTNFPRHTTSAVAQWVSEAQEVDASTPGTDDVMVTPHALAAFVELSRQLILTSSIDAEAFVREEILRRINLGIDKAALIGPGTQGVPKGVFVLNTSTSGIHTVTFGAAPTWKKVLSFEGEIEDADGLMGNLAFITSAPVKSAWKGTSKDTGSGLFLCTEGNQANGYPVLVTSQLGGTDYANHVVFGNFGDMIVGMYGSIEILTDQSAALQRRGLVGITGLAHADVAFRHPESFAVSTDAGNQ